MIDDPVRKRLLALADESGTSLSALSRLIGRNPSYMQQFVRKGSPRKLEENDRKLLAEFFGVDEAVLSGGVDAQEKSFARDALAQRSRADWIDIPRLALGASAGSGAVAADEVPVGHLRFSSGWLREQGLAHKALSAITVEGDSMEATLHDGDEIIVNCALTRLRDGIHVVRRDDTLLVKRLHFTAPGLVSIISDNHAYPSHADVPLGEVEVLGRVVWKGGRL
ncbi:S24 family peptidase [Croceicoccus sp. F390]|uniref:S24 family peptidase n=1 Tax=Croceicoccus esteveae TaxID=3075597 RepID=A0ABU2ZFG3_9SPHN|nr:S24 family peptidase [Croceicoccus sp. F390]MDT0575044.1 S24 family peptidase [Croceicoccus sp. F390]